MKHEVFEDAFNLLCGERIGAGVSREIFECALMPDCVVKVETDQSAHQNIMEWEVWNDVSVANYWRFFCGN